jgi:GntR family transcriptional regulator
MAVRAKQATKTLRPRGMTLGRQLAETLRKRIMSGEFAPGTRLPPEADITEEYGVSRVTVRTAMQLLESQGLVDVRHGSGSYVCDFGGGIRAGLQELRSMSSSIRDMGMVPQIERHVAVRRNATPIEAAKLQITEEDQVVYLERAVRADGDLVAFSHEVILDVGMSDRVLAKVGTVSMFADLETLGILPVRALAEVHAVSSKEVGWGKGRPASGLYLLLEQVHFDQRGRAVVYSKTYFVEGRFEFAIIRTR